MSLQQNLAAGRLVLIRTFRHSSLHGSEIRWAIAFIVPYAAVLLAFAVYPIAYGFWMASAPSLYAELLDSDEYLDAVVTTLLYVGVGVNLTMFLALILSGYFIHPPCWINAPLPPPLLPCTCPPHPSFIAPHSTPVYPRSIQPLPPP